MPNIVITGGSRGIGESMVRLFAREGWRVLFTDLKSEEAAQALSTSRRAIAGRFERQMEEELRQLNMEGTQFAVRFSQAHPSAEIIRPAASRVGNSG